MKYHYTYRITNIVEKKYYYGVHSCNCHPKEDIGVKYFSSSKRSTSVKHQKENPQQYKYKVVKIFSTRVEAVEHEIFLHKKFNVKIHEKFYNSSNQTSTKFDTSGMTLCKNENGEYFMLSTNDPKYKTIYFPVRPHCIKDKLPPEHKKKISLTLTGVKHTETRIENNRLAQLDRIPYNKDIAKGIYYCDYCSVHGGLPFITAYHGNNCKHKANTPNV